MTAKQEKKLMASLMEEPVEMKPGEHFCCYWELARWLEQGNGLICFGTPSRKVDVSMGIRFELFQTFDSPDNVYIRKWDDYRWHEPTREYMGLAISKSNNKLVIEE